MILQNIRFSRRREYENIIRYGHLNDMKNLNLISGLLFLVISTHSATAS